MFKADFSRLGSGIMNDVTGHKHNDVSSYLNQNQTVRSRQLNKILRSDLIQKILIMAGVI
jgi:hypothetical protein